MSFSVGIGLWETGKNEPTRSKLESVKGIAKEGERKTETMTVQEAKAKIFHWLCSRYRDPGKGNEYIDKDTVRDAINIPEEVFGKALDEFIDPGEHICVEVDITTRRVS